MPDFALREQHQMRGFAAVKKSQQQDVRVNIIEDGRARTVVLGVSSYVEDSAPAPANAPAAPAIPIVVVRMVLRARPPPFAAPSRSLPLAGTRTRTRSCSTASHSPSAAAYACVMTACAPRTRC